MLIASVPSVSTLPTATASWARRRASPGAAGTGPTLSGARRSSVVVVIVFSSPYFPLSKPSSISCATARRAAAPAPRAPDLAIMATVLVHQDREQVIRAAMIARVGGGRHQGEQAA